MKKSEMYFFYSGWASVSIFVIGFLLGTIISSESNYGMGWRIFVWSFCIIECASSLAGLYLSKANGSCVGGILNSLGFIFSLLFFFISKFGICPTI